MPKSNELALANKERSLADNAEKRASLALQAYQLRLSGVSWWDIAAELGLSEHAVTTLVAERIKMAAALVDEGSKRQMLVIEMERLDKLQQAAWPKAMGGDSRSIQVILKIIETRAKLLGLDQTHTTNITSNTIVVPGTSHEYVAALRGVTEAIAS